MTPTNELRFVKRYIPIGFSKDGGQPCQTVRILQQKWIIPTQVTPDEVFIYNEEWRDVPEVGE